MSLFAASCIGFQKQPFRQFQAERSGKCAKAEDNSLFDCIPSTLASPF